MRSRYGRSEAESHLVGRAESSATTGEFFKAKTVTDDEVNAAVDVFMRYATVNLFRFASGHTLNPAAAVKRHEPARLAIADPDRTEKFRCGMVRTPILLARPEAQDDT